MLAVIWLFVQPEAPAGATAAQVFLLRWGHSICWALLALLCVLIAGNSPAPVRRVVGVAAGVAYAGFLGALLRSG